MLLPEKEVFELKELFTMPVLQNGLQRVLLQTPSLDTFLTLPTVTQKDLNNFFTMDFFKNLPIKDLQLDQIIANDVLRTLKNFSDEVLGQVDQDPRFKEVEGGYNYNAIVGEVLGFTLEKIVQAFNLEVRERVWTPLQQVFTDPSFILNFRVYLFQELAKRQGLS